MNKIKIEVHPSVLIALLIMAAVVFFFSVNHTPEIIQVKNVNSVEKSRSSIYEEFPDFPYVDESLKNEIYAPFVMDGFWWTYEEKDVMFIKTNLKY